MSTRRGQVSRRGAALVAAAALMLGAASAHAGSSCLADFDGNGQLRVNDLFVFLNAWFAGNPNADVAYSGTLSVHDIFAFFNAWFAGCP